MNASMRRWFYLLAGLVAALIPILMQTGVIAQDQGDAWVAALGSLVGGGAALTAAHHTTKQINAGMHDPPQDPVDQVLSAIPAVLEQQAQANANVDKLRQATGELLSGNIFPAADTVGQVVTDTVQDTIDSILKGTP